MKKNTLFQDRKSQNCQENKNPVLIYKLNETVIKISQRSFFYLGKMILSSLEEQISQNSHEYSEKEKQEERRALKDAQRYMAMVFKTVWNFHRNR